MHPRHFLGLFPYVTRNYLDHLHRTPHFLVLFLPLDLGVRNRSDRRKPNATLPGQMLPTRLQPIELESSSLPSPPSHRHHTHTTVPFAAHDFLEGAPI
jgi:hypothetical protein